MQRAAVHDELPVHSGAVHLLGERRHIAERHVRVQGTVADQQPGLHRAGLCSPAGAQTAVNANRARHGFPGPGQPERYHAAEAEADRSDPAVSTGAARQRGQARPRPAHHQQRVIPQSHQAADNTVPVACHAIAEHVAGQNDIPECRVTPGLPARVLIEASAAVDKQYTRSRAR